MIDKYSILKAFGLQHTNVRDYQQDGKHTPAKHEPYPAQVVEAIEPFTIQTDDDKSTSWLGTPVFSDLQLEDETSGVSLYLDTVIMEVSLPKNIVKTQIVGRAGTVKEYISDDDYQITIRGAIVNPQSKNYPIDDVAFFSDLMRQPRSLKAISAMLNLFGITDIVVEDARWLPIEGFINTQFIEISCVSDLPIQLISDDQTYI